MRGLSIGARITAATVVAAAATAFLIEGAVPAKAASARIPRCSNIQLAIEPMNKGLGAALGHIGRWYRVRELWGPPCSLQGFPRVQLLDARHHPSPVRVG